MEIDRNDESMLRAITSELNCLTRSDGSAIITQGMQVNFSFVISRLTFLLIFRWLVLHCVSKWTNGSEFS